MGFATDGVFAFGDVSVREIDVRGVADEQILAAMDAL